jgi:hypothetical protein
MKKIVSILSIVALASCGGGASSNEIKSDSTVVDSTKTDSTVLIPLDDSVKLGNTQPGTLEEVK